MLRTFLGTFGASLFLVACTAATPSPTAPPKPAASPAAKPAASPVGKPEAKAPAAWEQEWERTLQAARQEGRVVMFGPQGADRRESLAVGFEAKYGITVEYTPVQGAEVPPRVSAERGAGQFLWDLYIGGSTTVEFGLKPMGNTLEPFEPLLILPEVKDPSNWRLGRLDLDDDKVMLRMTLTHGGTIFINTDLVKPQEIRSHKDLLDPKWKGQIIIDDPRVGGPGQGTLAFFWLHPELGPDFIRGLAAQESVLVADRQGQVDQVGRGRYPILIGASDSLVEQRIRAGVPIHIMQKDELREGTDVRAAASYLSVFNRHPNPNATKVYVNWLLTKDGQVPFMQAAGYISQRLDVPTDHLPAWRIPDPRAQLISTEDPRGMQARLDMAPLVVEVFGQR